MLKKVVSFRDNKTFKLVEIDVPPALASSIDPLKKAILAASHTLEVQKQHLFINDNDAQEENVVLVGSDMQACVESVLLSSVNVASFLQRKFNIFMPLKQLLLSCGYFSEKVPALEQKIKYAELYQIPKIIKSIESKNKGLTYAIWIDDRQVSGIKEKDAQLVIKYQSQFNI